MALFTAETAAEMGRRSAQLRKERALLPQPTEPTDTPKSLPAVEPTDSALDFAKQRLSRVRTQLDRIDALAAEETDPKQLKFLADAAGRLQEQERQLAGRPLPGTLKPSIKPSKRPDPLPEPTPCVAPQLQAQDKPPQEPGPQQSSNG